ncbi:MAG TPA: hypothetical protein VMI32_21345 [Candidatus Solibacter sp.]|nr:hypothetical protein [Candidatus Solibacter sp.]
MKVARVERRRHTENMAVPKMRGSLTIAALAVAFCAAAISARADEIRLKDGKKLYGVIVAYEDNMFKVKTDFGYVLVEKDKIASIVPSMSAKETPKTEKTPAAKKEPATDGKPKEEPAVASAKEEPAATNASEKSVEATAGKREKTPPRTVNAAVKPSAPANKKTDAVAPAITSSTAAPGAGLTASAGQPAAPKEPEPPAMREDIRGNLYTNYTHGFKMYKAPSWDLIEDARKALPNAIVALGTYNESTLMVIGQEKTKESLEPAAATVEKRLSDVYDNYRSISRRKTTVGGLPAVEYHYRGLADGHDWSGTLAVVARGNEIFTVLGMTFADDDLIQIQENVISRAIASLDFNVH